MANDVATLNARGDAAQTALLAGNFATARLNILSALAIMGTLPDGAKGGTNLQWDRAALLDLLKCINQQESAAAVNNAGGIQRVNTKRSKTTG